MAERRRRVSVAYGDVSIDVILDEPVTPCVDALVLLPSSSRDSEDFDEIACAFRRGWPPRPAPAAARHGRQQRAAGGADVA